MILDKTEGSLRNDHRISMNVSEALLLVRELTQAAGLALRSVHGSTFSVSVIKKTDVKNYPGAVTFNVNDKLYDQWGKIDIRMKFARKKRAKGVR